MSFPKPKFTYDINYDHIVSMYVVTIHGVKKNPYMLTQHWDMRTCELAAAQHLIGALEIAVDKLMESVHLLCSTRGIDSSDLCDMIVD